MNVYLPDGAVDLREQLLELLRAQALTGVRLEALLSATALLTPAQGARALPAVERLGLVLSVVDDEGTLLCVGTAREVAEVVRAVAGLGGAG